MARASPGLSKELGESEDGRTNSYVGTVEYMAPEIVSGVEHDKAVDWWSLGVLLHELVTSKSVCECACESTRSVEAYG